MSGPLNPPEELEEEARRLLDALGEGSMSESAYDTAWVARVPSPSSAGEPIFPQCYDWLLRNQRPDGAWGAEIPFAHDRVICTLAALVTLASSSYRREESEPAARRAIVYLNTERPNLRDDPAETVGFELLLPELARQAKELRLSLPYDDWKFVEDIRADKLNRIPPIAIYGGPTSLTHSLEYLGDRLVPSLVHRCQGSNGSYGASPSATAFVELRAHEGWAQSYLRRVVSISPTGGVISAYPITIFEMAWALQSLWPFRESIPAYHSCVQRLAQYWTPQGVGFTETAMVSDADDTAMALWVLRKNGIPVDSEVLELFEGEECFFCYPFERNQSVAANAGILEALKLYESTPDRRRMTLKLVHYLRNARVEGRYWLDKWHVSPMYATARAIRALTGLDNATVRAAVEWLLQKQNEDGSWGLQGGTPEETAYGLEGLLAARDADPALRADVDPAANSARSYLMESLSMDGQPALWIEKSLYTPHHVARAAIVGALARAEILNGKMTG